MELTQFAYEEHPHPGNDWELADLELGRFNLVVGKNATGKTRTLNVITALSKLVSGVQVGNGQWEAEWTSADGEVIRYCARKKDGLFDQERLEVSGDLRIDRSSQQGNIWFSAMNQMVPIGEDPAAPILARRDSVQHPFLEPVHAWASRVYRFNFGSEMGRTAVGVFSADGSDVDARRVEHVVGALAQGLAKHGEQFGQAIVNDMTRCGYPISEVRVHELADIPALPEGFGFPKVVSVQEPDLGVLTTQVTMSQGMWRTLSLIVLLQYALHDGAPSCVMVDDIGEGIDYERSCNLVRLLEDRSQESGTQIIVTSNNRFVMNSVDLKYWTVLRRAGAVCRAYNARNSRDDFETFRFVGLSNAEFFEGDFLGRDERTEEEE